MDASPLTLVFAFDVGVDVPFSLWFSGGGWMDTSTRRTPSTGPGVRHPFPFGPHWGLQELVIV